jgi:hypothetical protein
MMVLAALLLVIPLTSGDGCHVLSYRGIPAHEVRFTLIVEGRARRRVEAFKGDDPQPEVSCASPISFAVVCC